MKSFVQVNLSRTKNNVKNSESLQFNILQEGSMKQWHRFSAGKTTGKLKFDLANPALEFESTKT
jgi:flavin reductase (DIM6/NTAB) family NADH-FMN oxidoreductase RutF